MGNENFTAYTAVDAEEDLVVTANKVLMEQLGRDQEIYNYKDFGLDFFNEDLVIEFEISLASTSDNVALIYPLSLSTGLGSFTTQFDNNEECATMYFYWSSGNVFLNLRIVYQGSSDIDGTAGILSPDTTYYITFVRDADGGANGTGRHTVYIRSDSHTGTLLDTLVQDSRAGQSADYRYCLCPCGSGDGNSADFDGFVQNLNLNLASSYLISKINGISIDTVAEIFGIAPASIKKINGVTIQ